MRRRRREGGEGEGMDEEEKEEEGEEEKEEEEEEEKKKILFNHNTNFEYKVVTYEHIILTGYFRKSRLCEQNKSAQPSALYVLMLMRVLFLF